ncbi:MAG: hypothetical protein MJA84_10835, partial [Firmicutes bacterium]|nr:hypothetical protein [Bacillota bacterium]
MGWNRKKLVSARMKEMHLFTVQPNVVLVAHDVNLSIFKTSWLAHHELILEDEIGPELIVSPSLVQIPTKEFTLLVLPDRIQLTIETGISGDSALQHLLRILGGISSLLPHTPFTAMGFNFHNFLVPDIEEDLSEWTVKRFRSPATSAADKYGATELRCGSYFSFDHLEMRVRVDSRPVE